MADVFKIEIEDANSLPGEVWVHKVPIGSTTLKEIAKAVEVLYPTTTELYIRVEEEPDEESDVTE